MLQYICRFVRLKVRQSQSNADAQILKPAVSCVRIATVATPEYRNNTDNNTAVTEYDGGIEEEETKVPTMIVMIFGNCSSRQ